MKGLIVGSMGLLLLAGGACLAQSNQPSLAELAKQNKSAKKVCKTLTNDDVAMVSLSADSGRSASAVASTPVNLSDEPLARTEGKKDTTASSSSASKDAPAVADLKKALSTYQVEQDGWKHSAKRYEDLLVNETSDFRRQMYQDALDSDKQNVALFQEKIDHTQAELAKAQKETGSGNGSQP